MKNPFVILIVTFFLIIILHQKAPEDLRYPSTDRGTVTDTYFDTTIADPYRWLEDDYARETKTWVTKQNAFTSSYMRKIPVRRKIEKRLTEIWNYPSQGAPFKKGDKYYFYKNDGLQNQAVLYVQDSPTSESEIFMDPNQFSNDGTIALGGIYFSQNHKYMGYSINVAGSDWQEFFVKDLTTGELLSDHLTWIKFSGMSWQGNGFYYKKYPTPDENEELSATNENAKVYYHRLGTPQEADELIYYEADNPKLSPSISVSDDGRFMFLYRSSGTYGNMLSFRDTKVSDEGWTPLVDDLTSNCYIMDNIGDQLIAQTDRNAPFKKIVRIDTNNPDESHWITLIEGTKDQVLSSVNLVGGKFFAHFTQDVTSVWKVYDLDGTYLYNVDLPGKGIVGGFGGDKDQMITWYTFNNSVNPPTLYQYNIQL
ncbi:MAG: S9 family peptidase, partial [bacterium]